VAAILDIQNGRRYGQVQFVNDVVDYITTAEGRQLCYDLLEALRARQDGVTSPPTTVTLGNLPGIPKELQGRTFEIVDDESDAEKFDRQWRAAKYLKPQEAAALLRVDPRTVKRWAQQGRLAGFQTPGGHWRIDESAVQRMLRGPGPVTTGIAVAEIDLGPCAMCGAPLLAGDEFVSVIEVSADGPLKKVSNQHAVCAVVRGNADEK
jgi:excisionase family DNA binding protein